MITVTPEASEHMRKLIAESDEPDIKGIRISVMAGGCSGFSYQLDFESEPELDDNVFGENPLRNQAPRPCAPRPLRRCRGGRAPLRYPDLHPRHR